MMGNLPAREHGGHSVSRAGTSHRTTAGREPDVTTRIMMENPGFTKYLSLSSNAQSSRMFTLHIGSTTARQSGNWVKVGPFEVSLWSHQWLISSQRLSAPTDDRLGLESFAAISRGDCLSNRMIRILNGKHLNAQALGEEIHSSLLYKHDPADSSSPRRKSLPAPPKQA